MFPSSLPRTCSHLFVVAFDLSGLTHLEHLEVTSNMSEALVGWLPRSLAKLSIRDAACALASIGMPGTDLDIEECIILEGPALQRVMGF